MDNLFSGATGPTGAFVTLAGDQTLTTGIKTFTNLPQSTATPSNNSDLINKLYVDNIITGLTGTYITLAGNQTLTTGIKTFTNLPQSTAIPSANSDLTNKLYVDNIASGITGSFVTLGGNQVLTAGIKTFTDLPECSAVPSNNANLTNKSYVDNNFINIVGNQTLTTGIKTFTNLPQSTATPSASADLTNKLYVDNAVAGVIGGTGTFLTLSGSQTLTTGIKTFTNLPQCTATPSSNSDLTNKLYVDNNFVNLVGNQTLTSGVKTFTNLPQSTATPSSNSDLINKLYVDNKFVDISNAQTITGNKTFDASTTTIRGTLLDVFPTTTQLYSGTTNIAGSTFFLNSTTNTIAGTTTYLSSPTVIVNNSVNSFYVDCSYANFVGDEFLLNSPYAVVGTPCNLFEINPVTLRLKSPTISVQDTCNSFTIDASNTYFTGTNTDLTGTNATATTQISTDNSTKIATTAFVTNHTLANYMTTNTNQSIPTAIKTYGGKQVFNAGTACSTYDNTSLTDMTLANNSQQGILSIAGTRIQTDTYGVRLALDRYNLQISEGTFIQANNAVGFNDYTKPDFVFGVNKITGYVDIVGVPNSAQGSIQMNNIAGIFSWFAGYNQTTTFTISHSIITTSSAIASMNEAEVYFYFQDFNTGIVRYTTPNLATTTGFALPANSTVIRPIITFDLTTATLPQGDYRIFGYSRVTNAYATNAGVLSVLFGVASSPSIETAIQNYNTPIDYTFTSRNLYHCFRNTAMCGVYLSNNIATQQEILTPIHYSITDFTNFMSQPTTSGAVSTPAVTGGSAVGNFNAFSVNNSDNRYIVYPNYSIILYNSAGWTGTIYINFKNTTSNPVCVAPTTTQAGSSCRIYFDEVELIKY